MVDYGYKVKTVNFGSPPDPEKPQPHYPGVSSIRFDPMEALTVYREVVTKERDLMANQKQNIEDRKGPVPHKCIMHDMLPGYGSVGETYAHMGFTVNAQGVWVPPDIKAPSQKRSSSRPSGSSSRRDNARRKSPSSRLSGARYEAQSDVNVSRPSSRPGSAAFQSRQDSIYQKRPSSRPTSAASQSCPDNFQKPAPRRPSSQCSGRPVERPGSSSRGSRSEATLRSSSAPALQKPHWDMPRMPDFKSFSAAPKDGICGLSQKDLATLAKQKALLYQNCGQNRVFVLM